MEPTSLQVQLKNYREGRDRTTFLGLSDVDWVLIFGNCLPRPLKNCS